MGYHSLAKIFPLVAALLSVSGVAGADNAAALPNPPSYGGGWDKYPPQPQFPNYVKGHKAGMIIACLKSGQQIAFKYGLSWSALEGIDAGGLLGDAMITFNSHFQGAVIDDSAESWQSSPGTDPQDNPLAVGLQNAIQEFLDRTFSDKDKIKAFVKYVQVVEQPNWGMEVCKPSITG